MDKLGFILKKDKSWEPLYRHQERIQILHIKWPDILGKLAEDVRIESLKDGNLVLSTQNPLWVQEIQFYKQTILDKVNSALKASGIKSGLAIRIRIFHQEIEKNGPILPLKKKSKTLEEAIHQDILTKRKKGLILCEMCQSVYVKSGICDFCRIENTSPQFKT